MKDKRCEPVRRELEELMLNDNFSAATGEHLRTCFECREFQRQQTKLRQIVGSLGTVNAPADFDFRLRARLVADAEAPSFRFWTITVKGLATAAVLVVFGVGAVMVWQRVDDPTPAVAVAQPPQVTAPEAGAGEDPNRQVHWINDSLMNPAVADNRTATPPRKPKPSRPANTPKRTVSTVDFSSERATVISNTPPAVDNATVFPIEASLQSVKVSLDDGRGNARTISFPTVSFGSQRVLTTTANQFNSKGEW
ncbi:MAG TPA: hypothetical protein VFY61_19190 [Pyrinomonadaceae bacterium]|nr:hypothetical protein [Pyrinomonadaceae bacterium]